MSEKNRFSERHREIRRKRVGLLNASIRDKDREIRDLERQLLAKDMVIKEKNTLLNKAYHIQKQERLNLTTKVIALERQLKKMSELLKGRVDYGEMTETDYEYSDHEMTSIDFRQNLQNHGPEILDFQGTTANPTIDESTSDDGGEDDMDITDEQEHLPQAFKRKSPVVKEPATAAALKKRRRIEEL